MHVLKNLRTLTVHAALHAFPSYVMSALQCVTKCCEKFMNVSARTGARFQEFFTEMEKQVCAGGPDLGSFAQ